MNRINMLKTIKQLNSKAIVKLKDVYDGFGRKENITLSLPTELIENPMILSSSVVPETNSCTNSSKRKASLEESVSEADSVYLCNPKKAKVLENHPESSKIILKKKKSQLDDKFGTYKVVSPHKKSHVVSVGSFINSDHRKLKKQGRKKKNRPEEAADAPSKHAKSGAETISFTKLKSPLMPVSSGDGREFIRISSVKDQDDRTNYGGIRKPKKRGRKKKIKLNHDDTSLKDVSPQLSQTGCSSHSGEEILPFKVAVDPKLVPSSTIIAQPEDMQNISSDIKPNELCHKPSEADLIKQVPITSAIAQNADLEQISTDDEVEAINSKSCGADPGFLSPVSRSDSAATVALNIDSQHEDSDSDTSALTMESESRVDEVAPPVLTISPEKTATIQQSVNSVESMSTQTCSESDDLDRSLPVLDSLLISTVTSGSVPTGSTAINESLALSVTDSAADSAIQSANLTESLATCSGAGDLENTLLVKDCLSTSTVSDASILAAELKSPELSEISTSSVLLGSVDELDETVKYIPPVPSSSFSGAVKSCISDSELDLRDQEIRQMKFKAQKKLVDNRAQSKILSQELRALLARNPANVEETKNLLNIRTSEAARLLHEVTSREQECTRLTSLMKELNSAYLKTQLGLRELQSGLLRKQIEVAEEETESGLQAIKEMEAQIEALAEEVLQKQSRVADTQKALLSAQVAFKVTKDGQEAVSHELEEFTARHTELELVNAERSKKVAETGGHLGRLVVEMHQLKEKLMEYSLELIEIQASRQRQSLLKKRQKCPPLDFASPASLDLVDEFLDDEYVEEDLNSMPDITEPVTAEPNVSVADDCMESTNTVEPKSVESHVSAADDRVESMAEPSAVETITVKPDVKVADDRMDSCSPLSEEDCSSLVSAESSAVSNAPEEAPRSSQQQQQPVVATTSSVKSPAAIPMDQINAAVLARVVPCFRRFQGRTTANDTTTEFELKREILEACLRLMELTTNPISPNLSPPDKEQLAGALIKDLIVPVYHLSRIRGQSVSDMLEAVVVQAQSAGWYGRRPEDPGSVKRMAVAGVRKAIMIVANTAAASRSSPAPSSSTTTTTTVSRVEFTPANGSALPTFTIHPNSSDPSPSNGTATATVDAATPSSQISTVVSGTIQPRSIHMMTEQSSTSTQRVVLSETVQATIPMRPTWGNGMPTNITYQSTHIHNTTVQLPVVTNRPPWLPGSNPQQFFQQMQPQPNPYPFQNNYQPYSIPSRPMAGFLTERPQQQQAIAAPIQQQQRMMQATAPIQQQYMVANRHPAAFPANGRVHEPSPRYYCFVCGHDADQTCSGCETTYYCTRQCQLSHWEDHSRVCVSRANRAREAPENIPPG